MSEQRNRPPLSEFLIDPAPVYHPATPDSRGEKLAARIARVVTRRTAGSVQNLRVEVRRDGVFLDGQCPSYYAKQLAQQAAMTLADDKPLTNRIEVV
ncbi:MAG TPA: BON domain-containing protein [Pirellulales bacterium]|nr:BON domain-containing protein [Pirellulales bacterium]